MDERQSGGWAEGTGRAERPLGRGLEDVSHLFQTQRRAGMPDASPVPAAASPADRDEQAGVIRPAAVLFRPHTGLSRPQLAGMLREVCAGLEEGLRVIDERVPCPPCGEIDILALDRANHLAIVDFDSSIDDGLLLRGLGHADWIGRNLPNVRRMYAGRVVNFSAPPRIFLVAPDFSPVVRRVAPLMPRVECARFHAVDTGPTVGIFFEPLTGS